MAKRGTSRSIRLATYPHHFNGGRAKAKPSYCNPHKLLYVKHVDGVIVTRPAMTEHLSAVAP